MSDEHEVKNIAIAIVESDDRFLIGQRPEGSPLAGFWEFPGGKVELNETFDQAAERECLEETGLNVSADFVLLENTAVYSHGTVRLHFVSCTLKEPLRKPNAPFRWVHRQDLRHFRFPEGNREILEKIAQRRS